MVRNITMPCGPASSSCNRWWAVRLVGTGKGISGAARITISQKGRSHPVSVVLVASDDEEASERFIAKYQAGHGAVDGWFLLKDMTFANLDLFDKASVYFTLMGMQIRKLARGPLSYTAKSRRFSKLRINQRRLCHPPHPQAPPSASPLPLREHPPTL